MTIRLLAVDRHELVRLGLGYAAAQSTGVELVGAAGTVAEAVRVAATCRPDVLTTGLLLPDGDGITLAGRLRERLPDLGVLLLTAADEDNVLFRAMAAGLSGYLTLAADSTAVLDAVRHAAAAPYAFRSPGLTAALSTRRMHGGLLSEREREVLGLLRDGISQPAIASRLGVRDSTVKTYVSRIYEKLRVRNRTQALMAALSQGLLPVEVDAS